MKWVKAIAVASILFIVTWIGVSVYYSNEVKEMSHNLWNANTDLRNSNINALDELLDEKTMWVLGSSELGYIKEMEENAYPYKLLQDCKDYNMLLSGRGYVQSFSHAIDVGAYGKLSETNKVVLILSPQWFTQTSLTPDIFASVFQDRSYVEFMKNEEITYETKQAVATRAESLLASYPQGLELVELYNDVYVNKSLNPLKRIKLSVYNAFADLKNDYEIVNAGYGAVYRNATFNAEDINWQEEMDIAYKIGQSKCNNNDYYIYDYYWDKYIKESYEEKKGSYTDVTYTESPEYDDFKLFLKVCQELDIEPLIISIPCHGYWYDYCNFSKEDRQMYYENIRIICDEYGVELADFSDKEYEPYFLKDIMHLGWKGWVYLDEAVYKFYKEN